MSIAQKERLQKEGQQLLTCRSSRRSVAAASGFTSFWTPNFRGELESIFPWASSPFLLCLGALAGPDRLRTPPPPPPKSWLASCLFLISSAEGWMILATTELGCRNRT